MSVPLLLAQGFSLNNFISQGGFAGGDDIRGAVEEIDLFGRSLAAGDFNGDGAEDLAVGIPGEDTGSIENAGAVNVLYGTFLGLTPLNNLLFTQDEVDVSDLAGGTGGSKMHYFHPPSNVPPTTSDLGGTVTDDDGKKIPFLAPGDTMPLSLLIHGMMMRSCNRSSVAIGEHVALAVEGDPRKFIIMMNERAAELGMTSQLLDLFSVGTRFGHPAFGCVTRPQHLITLLREGSKHPLFLKYASRTIYGHIAPDIELCGTDAMGDEKCNNPFGNIQSLSGYPGRLAWKGGNGGQWWSDNQADDVPAKPGGIPWCTTAQVGIAERAGRTLLMALQQTANNSSDTRALFNYGFKKVFTPDCIDSLRYPSGQSINEIVSREGPIRIKDFACDALSSRFCVTAVIDDHEELRLQIWDTNVAAGTITARGSAKTSYALLGGARWSPPTLVAMVDLPTSGSIGDYFTANLKGDGLNLKLWRVGEHP